MIENVDSHGLRDAEFVAMNQEYFRRQTRESFVEVSPHLKHEKLGELFEEVVASAFAFLAGAGARIRVLDMGSGDGTFTLPCLAFGAEVLAVDASDELLTGLERSAAKYHGRLNTLRGDIFRHLEALEQQGYRFDMVGATSFLHHIPDYLGMCKRAAGMLGNDAVFFTFQDPLRYDTVSPFTYFFERVSYFSWRLFQGNYLQGVKTRWRRLRGDYRDDIPEDVTEYHVVRNGVDQFALVECLEGLGFQCQVRRYWSTQSSFFQWVGEILHLANTFGIIATRKRV